MTSVTRSSVFTASVLALFAASATAKDQIAVPGEVVPLLQRYCFECHGDESSSGELNLAQLIQVAPIVKHRDRWSNVIEQTRNEVMPPAEEPQPSDGERQQIVKLLSGAIRNFDYSRVNNPGYEAVRRLTHREYANTVRDLFGVEIQVGDRFPDDLSGISGFKNSANSLFIQPLLMERYLGTAEFVVSQALPADPVTARHRMTRKQLLGEPSDGEPELGEVLDRFLERAYRRPVDEEELNHKVATVRSAIDGGATRFEALTGVMQTVLISPSFLLRIEADRGSAGDTFPVDDWELASRLSYFLWCSMPDERLFQLARQGKLQDPEVLAQEVTRMVADPKSEALGSVFAAEWLGSQHLGTRIRLDPIDNPWCTETLMAAMRRETELFFVDLVRRDRPVSELITADYTFLNEELAGLYRIGGIQGNQMRRVDVDPTRRGGILAQGSVLAVTAFPGRTSPVVRGKWILADLLGTPPPPPPPNVSEFSEEVQERERLSFREKLELHREKSNCNACHRQMDPLGFGLENFDWFGRYRTRWGRRPIDATGRLPDGTQFEGLKGLKRVLIEKRHADLVRQVTSKMLSFALGRQLEYYDEPAVRRIVENLEQDDYRLQSLVKQIVLSYPFRYKRAPAP